MTDWRLWHKHPVRYTFSLAQSTEVGFRAYQYTSLCIGGLDDKTPIRQTVYCRNRVEAAILIAAWNKIGRPNGVAPVWWEYELID